MDAAERELLATTVNEALTSAPDAALETIGWRDMLAAEPDDAIAIVFTALGATGANAAVLDDVVATALGVEPRAELAVLIPEFTRWDQPGTHGLGTARAATANELLVVGDLGAGIVPIASARVTPVRGIDPDVGLCTIHVDGIDTEPLGLEPWSNAVALAQRAVSHQIAGASRAMLELACAHALERVQFGRPVAGFQAVRHKLAESLVAIEALEAVLDAAAEDPGPTTAALAKALAGQTARTVRAHCQQVLAGIGFTTDHAFHRFMKRTLVLDGLFGSADAVVVALGRELLTTRTVPTLIEL